MLISTRPETPLIRRTTSTWSGSVLNGMKSVRVTTPPDVSKRVSSAAVSGR